MPTETSLSKRIKRHVIGRSRTYFVATAPGFESLCFNEMQALGLPVEDARMISGGVEFNGRLADCYRANLHLRTANRILMRIDRFKATSFRQMEKRATAIPWELYLPLDSQPRFNVKAHHCRLYHSDAIGERFLKSIKKFKRWPPSEEKTVHTANQSIYIRGLDDRFTVSIDSSGEHLHKRGLKKHPGQAPLRETTAAAALLLAGYRGHQPLIDPMCGTGTFSLEAAMLAGDIPAGWFRHFDFMQWPSFQRTRWEYLKNQFAINSNDRAPLIFASDREPAACRHLERCLAQNRLVGMINVSRRNFFDFLPKDLTDQVGMVVINPPYGRRLESRPKSDQLFKKICTRLEQEYRGWHLILVSPNKKLARQIPFKLNKYPFSHGGLRPVMMIGTI